MVSGEGVQAGSEDPDVGRSDSGVGLKGKKCLPLLTLTSLAGQTATDWLCSKAKCRNT